MGSCCCGGPKYADETEARAAKEIHTNMKKEQERDKRTLRILLLGPGDSGKTTILKQMRKIHKGVISDDELHGFIAPIREAIFQYIYKLCKHSVLLMSSHPTDVEKSLYPLRDEFLENVHSKLTDEVIEKILTIWNDPGIQTTLALRSLFQLEDNVPYFMERIRDIAKADYLPNFQDYIRFRMRTTGYATEAFETGVDGRNYIFEFTDVGGQRSERRKWMSLVNEQINGVLYIMAIAEYDMLLFEDETIKRLDEAYKLFEDVMERGFFNQKSVILFFNKYDLFLEKIAQVPITVAFDDYPEDQDPHSPELVVEFLFAKFDELYHKKFENNNQSISALHFHCTTALDTDLIEKLLRDIQADLIRQKLQRAGYI